MKKEDKNKKSKSFFKKQKEWWTNLFKGYVIGIEDLFLASWKKIVALALLIILPVVYACVMSVAFWNPSDNLGRVPSAIFNADYSFVEVIQAEKTTDNKYTYRIGALMSENKDHVLGEKEDDDLDKVIDGIKNNDRLFLNTKTKDGNMQVTYNPENTFMFKTNSWDLFKNSLIKTSSQPENNGAKFKMRFSPNKQLTFKDITYFNNQSDIQKHWETGKYSAQMKIDRGYGASQAAKIGQLLNDNGAKIDNRNQPIINGFTTFENNFLAGYFLHTITEFSSTIFEQLTPIVRGFNSNEIAMKLFGTKGSVLNNPENMSPNDTKDKFDNNKYYLVNDSNALDTTGKLKLNNEDTLFGDGTGQNGKIHNWLNALLNLDKDNMSRLQEAMATSFNFTNFMQVVFTTGAKNKGEQDVAMFGTKALEEMMNKGKKDNSDALIKAYQEVMHNEFKIKINPFFKNNNIIEQTSTINLNSWFTNQMVNNPEAFFNLKMPYVLGSAFENVQRTINLKGWDPSKDLNINNNDTKKDGTYATVYGIGLGGMFLMIGLFVGTTMLRGVIKRNKQYSKLNFANWYISKAMIFSTIGFFQVTFAVWIAYGTVWHNVMSPSTAGYVYLWTLACDLAIIAILQGMQYIFSSPLLGGIIGVLYLMFNIACGGGSYPAVMEYGFFRVIQYVMIFKYVFQGLDQLNFGFNIVGPTSYGSNYMLQMWGIIIIFFFLFHALGVLASKWRINQATYGSYLGQYVYLALMQMKQTKQANNFRITKGVKKDGQEKYKYDWNALDGKFDLQRYLLTQEIVRQDKGFKWYLDKRKKLHLEEQSEVNNDD
ncbi:ABC transporter permease [Mesoplasma lactucae]|uniref:Uncharacterized protein n=1 Tax=Mesoplasma lactucae ATCC 49193 TaxID=81460 RepID=A0A291IR86_9MOLU|nr:ABC transporter permease [Mesoplasma lactucae]ATG97283.1 hypothetical protein CP520_00725 [Mesoplasma lactucae ATCC 49193]ATZ20267.1 hypothetical protein MLACT_v1c04460 [Mesoplasma lactucae ATCC 49193]MCL8216438.1 hypothetical protein [Mesoplasma lactucae ATCC 49193]